MKFGEDFIGDTPSVGDCGTKNSTNFRRWSSLAEIDVVFVFFAVEFFRFTSFVRGDGQVQCHASKIGNIFFFMRVARIGLSVHIHYHGTKKKDAHHAHRNLNFHPLGKLLLVTWVVTWVVEQSRLLFVQKNLLRKELSPMVG